MTEVEPVWLTDYLAERLDRVRNGRQDWRSRGEFDGALAVAVGAGVIAESSAEAWHSRLPKAVTTTMTHAVLRAESAPGSRRVDSPRPVPPARMFVEPRSVIVADALPGELYGNPVRLVAVGLFDEDVKVAIAVATSAQLWELERRDREWHEQFSEGRHELIDEERPRSVLKTVGEYVTVADDLGTRYQFAGGAGGTEWALCIDVFFTPAVPSEATVLRVGLRDERGQAVSEVRFELSGDALPRPENSAG
jgi:hypothetical protein